MKERYPPARPLLFFLPHSRAQLLKTSFRRFTRVDLIACFVRRRRLGRSGASSPNGSPIPVNIAIFDGIYRRPRPKPLNVPRRRRIDFESAAAAFAIAALGFRPYEHPTLPPAEFFPPT